jgi:hypothetical protein
MLAAAVCYGASFVREQQTTLNGALLADVTIKDDPAAGKYSSAYQDVAYEPAAGYVTEHHNAAVEPAHVMRNQHQLTDSSENGV